MKKQRWKLTKKKYRCKGCGKFLDIRDIYQYIFGYCSDECN